MGRVPKRPVAVATPASSRPGNSKTDKCRSADIQRDSRKDERTSRKDERTSRKEKARKVKKGSKMLVNSKIKKTDGSNKKGEVWLQRSWEFQEEQEEGFIKERRLQNEVQQGGHGEGSEASERG
jgi:hypothetical protein